MRGAAVVAAVLLAACGSDGGGAMAGRPALAFYYTWYKTPEVSGVWWHWNSDGHDPETIRADGTRDISSAFYPVLGPYDSSDGDVIRRHIRWARKAGLTGWILSWWGSEDPSAPAVEVVVRTLEEQGCPLRFSLYLESLPSWQLDALVSALDRIDETYGASACALRSPRGELEIFVYYRATFPGPGGVSLWRDAAQAREGRLRLWMDVDPMLEPIVSVAFPTFVGFHFYNPWVLLLLGGEEAVIDAYGSYAASLGAAGRPFGITVLPGYDDRELADRPFRWHEDRDEGRLYSDLLAAARAVAPDYVLVTTFNEWHEGTQIEPGVGYGEAYLDLTRAGLRGP